MSGDGGFWADGVRAWERLAHWGRDTPGRGQRRDDEGDRALQALTDIGVLRRLLDQVEFEAIRTGRRQGRSWAEIAVRLGITRQSAWERWQDVDKPADPQPPHDVDWEDTTTAAVRARYATAARGEMRRRSTIVVPNVIGMTWQHAQEVLRRTQLVGIAPDPDGPPLEMLIGPDDVVTDQSPESGAAVPPGSAVRLWTERGDGGSGVREPRRPRPDPKTARKMLDEAADEEAVG